jgi:hypothetical protein
MPVGAQPLYAWAPGGDPVVLPSAAEVRVGGATGVHYIGASFHAPFFTRADLQML